MAEWHLRTMYCRYQHGFTTDYRQNYDSVFRSNGEKLTVSDTLDDLNKQDAEGDFSYLKSCRTKPYMRCKQQIKAGK